MKRFFVRFENNLRMLVCNGRVSAVLVNQNKQRKQKMTPNDIATDVSGLTSGGPGSVATSVNYTYTFERMDDARTWD